MCDQCDELREELRQLRASIAPVEFVAPVEWGLKVGEDQLLRAFRSRRFLTVNGVIAATRSEHRLNKSQWDIDQPNNLASVYVSHLRKKLKAARAPYRIVTHHGHGYKLESLA